MIKNERQYRITKTQASKFASALRSLEKEPAHHLHPLLQKAQIDAIRSQYNDLQSAITEYEGLQSKCPAIIEATSLEELPRALIRARIALGMSQKELADRMGLKEQQLQRYEATEYSSASLARIGEVTEALGIRISENILLPLHKPAKEALYTRLDSAGIDTELLSRILPSDIATELESEDIKTQERSFARVSQLLNRIFEWSPEILYGTATLAFPGSAMATARFKIPAGSQGRRQHAYIVYAHYLGMVTATACGDLPRERLTLDASSLRQSLLKQSSDIDFATVLHHFWNCGVPVLPLSDPGIFHGACWRVNGRNVIVLKHRSKFLSRCVFDLLHEWFHAAQEPEAPTRSSIEEGDLNSTYRSSPEEQSANNFAGNVLLDGRAEEIVNKCVQSAKGNIKLLKSVVPKIAATEGVKVDHLANYLAWRLSLQGENWWGAANNLQAELGEPFLVAREIFFKRFNFGKVDSVDKKLLANALTQEGGC